MSDTLYFVSDSDMKIIADKIREKSGKTDDLLFPDDWEETIGNLSREDQLKASEYPTYVHSEVLKMVNKINLVRTDESIIFIAMSDSHYPADQTATTEYESNVKSNLQANRAAKALTYMVPVDFFAHLGDITCGASTTTPDMLKSQIDEFLTYFNEANSDLPVFLAIGNHDPGIYYHSAMADGNNYIMTGEYLYNNFTSHSASDNTIFGDIAYGGYCYRDFDDKKLRVFLLNTSEGIVYRQTDSCTLASQRLWLSNALLDLNAKSDASEWGFIVLCHYPADYGSGKTLSQVFEAYVNGSSVTITGNTDESFTSTTISFSGLNNAKFIAQFHGHVHNFLVDKLYGGSVSSRTNGTPTSQYDAYRIGIPNVQFNRENYYYNTDASSTDGTLWGIKYFEGSFEKLGADGSYHKTVDTCTDTSFVVNVINPSEEKIYSFCYGAGYDRVVGFGSLAYYTISRTLENAITNNTSISIEEGGSYSEVITLSSGYSMKSIIVTMGDVDITSTAVTTNDNKYYISISEVTGNIAITAKAQATPNFTNLVPFSVNTDGTDYYIDGDGYDNDVYLSGGTEYDKAGYVTTGYIPVKTGGKIIRIAGDGIAINDTYTRILFYNSDFSYNETIIAGNVGSSAYNGGLIKEDNTALTIEIYDSATNGYTNGRNCPYIRICTLGDGANLIVTVDEEITYGNENNYYSITYNLGNVTSSDTSMSVDKDSTFSTVLTANDGYELSSVIVTMGGVDITSSVYSSGQINIPSVTGNIVITAVGEEAEASYTNQLIISTDTDGSIYNGIGYAENVYISSGNIGTKSGCFASGFIPCVAGDTLYFKNCTMPNGNSYTRFALYDSSKTYLSNRQYNTSSNNLTFTFDSNDNVESVTIANTTYHADTAYIRFCCTGLDATSIVTVNEPI